MTRAINRVVMLPSLYLPFFYQSCVPEKTMILFPVLSKGVPFGSAYCQLQL